MFEGRRDFELASLELLDEQLLLHGFFLVELLIKFILFAERVHVSLGVLLELLEFVDLAVE